MCKANRSFASSLASCRQKEKLEFGQNCDCKEILILFSISDSLFEVNGFGGFERFPTAGVLVLLLMQLLAWSILT